MIWHRLVTFAAGIGLALSALAGTALAHPGPDSPAAAPASSDQQPQNAPAPSPAAHSPAVPRDQGFPVSALVVAGLALLAALPNRRRTLAITLTLLLATVAFEAVAHAALHLGHLSHADGLAIDASAVPPAAVEIDATPLRSSPLTPSAAAPARPDARR